jgi:hypothetical protein
MISLYGATLSVRAPVKFLLRFYVNVVAESVETIVHMFTRSCRHGQITSIHDGPWTRSEGQALDARVAAGQRATRSKAWTTRTQKAVCLQADLNSRALTGHIQLRGLLRGVYF